MDDLTPGKEAIVPESGWILGAVTVTLEEGKTFDLTIKAISQGYQQELLYKRWVDRNRATIILQDYMRARNS